jgi:hypothetical protein
MNGEDAFHHLSTCFESGLAVERPIWRGVSKGVEDGQRPLAHKAMSPQNGHETVLGVAHPQCVEGLGLAGPLKL